MVVPKRWSHRVLFGVKWGVFRNFVPLCTYICLILSFLCPQNFRRELKTREKMDGWMDGVIDGTWYHHLSCGSWVEWTSWLYAHTIRTGIKNYSHSNSIYVGMYVSSKATISEAPTASFPLWIWVVSHPNQLIYSISLSLRSLILAPI